MKYKFTRLLTSLHNLLKNKTWIKYVFY
jgi:hypothetical protein